MTNINFITGFNVEKLPKSTAKLIKSLQIKKYRTREQLFFVQGEKSFVEVLHSKYSISTIVGTEEFYAQYPELHDYKADKFLLNEKHLSSLGSFSSNDKVLAVVAFPKLQPLNVKEEEWVLVLDDIRDPGNFGTILRTADWYGIRTVVASVNSVDLYNPKVISSSMGSFSRVNVYYEDLETLFTGKNLNILVSVMDGENVRNIPPQNGGVLVMGNESNGVSGFWEKIPHRSVSIPGGQKTESLNVSVATAVLMERLLAS